MPNILIAASGTGGHIFPALAVAEDLPISWQINWLGVADRLETQLLPKRYPLKTVDIGGLQGNFFKKFFQVCKLLAAIIAVISFIKTRRIQIVFTTGGYIAAPAILAAKFCGIKVILHESNAFPGLVTRCLGRFCDFVAIGFPSAAEYLPKCRTVLTGTPARKSFRKKQSLPNWVPSGLGPLIVVVGGSQGALGLNQMVRSIYKLLLEKGCRIVHLTGMQDLECKSISHSNLVVKKFTNDVPGLLQNADIAISRAGAGIITELSISSTPAIFVPYPFAADDHQYFNAVYAAENGAAVIVHQENNQQKVLLKTLFRLLDRRLSNNSKGEDLLNQMKKGMQNIADTESHIKLLSIIIEAL
tara:strand:+ start:701 stop:1774 length:1074 start_codon:yes stop_codon:yes gene_type:complete